MLPGEGSNGPDSGVWLMDMLGGHVGVAVSDGSGVGVSGRGTGVSVGRGDLGVGGTGVSEAGSGVKVGDGVSGHGCAPTEAGGSDAIISTVTVRERVRLRKRIFHHPPPFRQSTTRFSPGAFR